MIRRTVKVQLAAFVVLTVMGVLYLGFDLIGLNALRPSYTVKARFAASGGIFTNAEVTYRGVGVGRVGPMRLVEDGVEVELRLDHGTKVPSDTLAIVANKSAVGEQYVDLQPRRDGAPYLAPGDTIGLADTRTPIHVQTVVLNLDRFVRSIDRQALTTLVDGLGDAFDGAGPSIQRLLDAGDALTAEFTRRLPETVELIRSGRVVLDTARATQADFTDFAEGLQALSESLRTADPDVRRLLDNGVVAARELDALLEPNAQALHVLVGDLVTVNELQLPRLGGLRQVLKSLPNVTVLGQKALEDDQLRNGLVVEENGQACTYPGVEQRLPQDKEPKAPDVDNHCPPGTSGQRGEEYAPRPDGSGSSGGPGAAPAGGGEAAGPGVLFAGGPETRWTGGQAEVLGERSWLSLLLALFG